MYKYDAKQMILPEDFFLPFEGKLNKNNRWVKLAFIIPWWEFEDKYKSLLKSMNKGQKALSVRVALGTLIIKERMRLPDEEVIIQISENPYLQYFLGFPRFEEREPFAASLITHFRKRFGAVVLNDINERIAKIVAEDTIKNEDDMKNSTNKDDNDNDNQTPSNGSKDEQAEQQIGIDEFIENQGKLILDATCAPADIQYPTDTRLLNDAREKLEEIIDVLHKPNKGKVKKPRTYRQKAHEKFIHFTKQRKPKPTEIRKMKGKLLRYIKRNLLIIKNLAEKNGLELLNSRQYKNFLVINELYRQQLVMYENRSSRVEDRIVSINQPHVRPIVRGKASASVEFGAKLAVSVVNGFVFCEKIEWDAYNEGNTLIESVKRYKEKHGFYPEAVLADKIYRTRDNRDFCKQHGIRLSGPKLGRSSEEEKKECKKQAKIDSGERNAVEGKFGESKRKYTLNKIMTRLPETSECTIIMNLIVMNLEKRLRLLLRKFLGKLFEVKKWNFNTNQRAGLANF